jgi:hypothetical protein
MMIATLNPQSKKFEPWFARTTAITQALKTQFKQIKLNPVVIETPEAA